MLMQKVGEIMTIPKGSDCVRGVASSSASAVSSSISGSSLGEFHSCKVLFSSESLQTLKEKKPSIHQEKQRLFTSECFLLIKEKRQPTDQEREIFQVKLEEYCKAQSEKAGKFMDPKDCMRVDYRNRLKKRIVLVEKKSSVAKEDTLIHYVQDGIAKTILRAVNEDSPNPSPTTPSVSIQPSSPKFSHRPRPDVPSGQQAPQIRRETKSGFLLPSFDRSKKPNM